MPRSTALPLLVTAACIPVALGIATHYQLEATARACAARASTAPEVISVAVPLPPVVLEVAKRPATGSSGLPFAFMSSLQPPHVVLAGAPSEGWAASPPRVVQDEPGGAVIRRDVDASLLPPELRELAGRTMHAFSASGRVCTGTLGAPYLVSELDGDISMVVDDSVDPSQARDPNQIWQAGRRTLVAELVGADNCKEALWARDIALPEPVIYTQQPEDDLPPNAARRAITALPEFTKMADQFAAEVSSWQDEPFTTRRLIDRLHPRRWRTSDGTGELAIYGVDGDEFNGCGGMSPAWGAAIIDGGGVSHAFFDEHDDVVLAVVDLDQDGLPEILTDGWMAEQRVLEPRLRSDPSENGFAEKSFARPSVSTKLEPVPYFGCAC